MDNEYDCLRLENQVCFPLYACSKEIIRRYRPMLDELEITYTQYITMMAMWDSGSSTVTDLGRKLYLDSGTLSPVLKSLETKGYVKRSRSRKDERTVMISVTEKGFELREKALTVPGRIASCIDLPPEKAKMLYDLLYEVLGQLSPDNKQ